MLDERLHRRVSRSQERLTLVHGLKRGAHHVPPLLNDASVVIEVREIIRELVRERERVRLVGHCGASFIAMLVGAPSTSADRALILRREALEQRAELDSRSRCGRSRRTRWQPDERGDYRLFAWVGWWGSL